MPIINQIAEYYNEMKTWRLQKDINLVGFKKSLLYKTFQPLSNFLTLKATPCSH